MSVTIAIDPSGNFEDGKGHTGIAMMSDNDWNSVVVESVYAKIYPNRHSYWQAVIQFIENVQRCTEDDITVVIESYVTRSNGFTIGKQSETSMFIGAIVFTLENLNIPYVFQTPSAVKTRFKDDLLCKYYPKMMCIESATGVNRYFYDSKITSDHIRDAMRHLLYYKRYTEYKIKGE